MHEVLELLEDQSESTRVRRNKIHNELEEIDKLSTRPLRACINKTATKEDKQKLKDLEKRAMELREELIVVRSKIKKLRRPD